MSQQRFLQQLRSSVQSNKEAAINAIKSQLGKANDGSFVLGRYYDGDNGIRTVIGVNAISGGVGRTMTIYEFDSIAQEKLTERLVEVEETLGIGEGGSTSTTTIVGRVENLEEIINNLLSESINNTKSIAYKIYESKQEIIGNPNTDTADSNTIEGAKKYADKAIEEALKEDGIIEEAISIAAAAATTKVAVGTDPNNVMSIEAKTNADNSTTYEISLADIAVQSELDEVKEFIGMTNSGEGEGATSIIEKIEVLDERITEEVELLEEKIQKNTDAITILNGTGDGSVHKQVADAITNLIDGADSKYDTLKEIADYIANDETSAAQMTIDIEDLKKSVNALSQTDVLACGESTLIKVSTSSTVNNDGKTEKKYTICANGIASLNDLAATEQTLTNKITEVSTALGVETNERKRVDAELDALIKAEATDRIAEDAKIQTQINLITGNSTSSIQSQISKAVSDLIGDATINGDTLGELEDRIDVLESDVNNANGKVQTEIRKAVDALDYADSGLLNHYVSSVSQTDGKISVTRQQFINAIVTEDSMTLGDKLREIDSAISSAESSAKAAATRIEVSGNDILSQSSVTDENGATTYTLNLGDTWDCGTFTYEELEEPQQPQ